MSGPCQYCTYPAEGEYRCDPAEPYMCGPCQKLLKPAQKIKDIRTLLAGLKTKRQVLKEEANHNHDRPFDSTHRLPFEIVADVFELCIPEELMGHSLPSGSRYLTTRAPLVLSAVCRRWRTIAHSTPRLWETLPIRVEKSSLHSSSTLPLLVKEWVDRAGELPLSIDLRVTAHNIRSDSDDLKTVEAVATQIINVLNKYSDRWLKLKYAGPPSLLPHFPSGEQDLPQLRTLDLMMLGIGILGFRGALNLHPKRLNTLSITKLMLVSVNFDWHHLTQLEMGSPSLPDCFEALSRAPRLTHCSFRHTHGTGLEQDEFLMPQEPMVHPKIQHLEISEVGPHNLYKKILQHLSFPSLKTLVLRGIESEPQGTGMSLVVEFLKKSGCSLERLSLLLPRSLSATDVTLLCHGIPTLQHLHVDFLGDVLWGAPKSLFALLEEFSIVSGRKEAQYLPALRSLTSYQNTFSDWTTLPNIFGTFTSHSMERHRHTLESVVISAISLPLASSKEGSVVDEVDEETLKKIIRLRETGVKLEIKQFRTETGKDMIDLAVERYYGIR